MLLPEDSMQLLHQTTKSRGHQPERCRACNRFATGTFSYETNRFRDHQPSQEPALAAGRKNREPQLRHHTDSRILASALPVKRERSEDPARRQEYPNRANTGLLPSAVDLTRVQKRDDV